MRVCVLCRIDRRGENDPRAFHLGGRRLPIVAVVAQRTDPGHRYFEVRVQDGRRFTLCETPATGAWELIAALPKARRQRRPQWRIVNVLGAMLGRGRPS